jgi:YVTN family beta-propeller protein
MKRSTLTALLIAGPAMLTAALVAVPAPADESSAPHFHQIKKIALGGEGGWDYLTMDGASHRLFVTRGTRVMVVDTDKDAVVGEVANTPGIHGVALAPKLNRGFTSNGRENTVTVFDLKTLKEVQRIPVGRNPDAILYDPGTRRVFTFNGGSNDVTAVDVETGKVAATIPVGGKPEFCATDEKGMVYCNIEDTSEILAIDARALKVKSRWPIAPVDGPSGLAIDRAHRRLFAVGGNQKMAVVDADTGKVIATPEIGKGPDAAAFDPSLGLAISSNGRDGTLTLIHEDSPNSFKVAATVPTQTGARTMAIDPKTHRIYLITATFKAPAAGEAGAPRRPTMEPNSAVILVYGP